MRFFRYLFIKLFNAVVYKSIYKLTEKILKITESFGIVNLEFETIFDIVLHLTVIISKKFLILLNSFPRLSWDTSKYLWGCRGCTRRSRLSSWSRSWCRSWHSPENYPRPRRSRPRSSLRRRPVSKQTQLNWSSLWKFILWLLYYRKNYNGGKTIISQA